MVPAGQSCRATIARSTKSGDETIEFASPIDQTLHTIRASKKPEAFGGGPSVDVIDAVTVMTSVAFTNSALKPSPRLLSGEGSQ